MCGIVGGIDTNGGRMGGEEFIRAISVQRDRGNGLGGGFAAYGIYPGFEKFYALHIACGTEGAARAADDFIKNHCYVKVAEDIPTRDLEAIQWHPMMRRYFVVPGPSNEDLKLSNMAPGSALQGGEAMDAFMKKFVFDFNKTIPGSFVMSCGKNMGVFKGVGYPEDIGRFFMLDKMEASIWMVHSRFPTNTQSWWGGAHPFTLLEWSVVHNGEITSYGVNRNYLEMFGYECSLKTDTEVISYLFDLLGRENGLAIGDVCTVLSPPLWEDIDRIEEPAERAKTTHLRQYYPQALLNGPFAILVSDGRSLIAMNDRSKLRPLVAARRGGQVFFSSEECSFQILCPDREETWMLKGGKPEIVKMKEAQSAVA